MTILEMAQVTACVVAGSSLHTLGVILVSRWERKRMLLRALATEMKWFDRGLDEPTQPQRKMVN